MSEPKKIQFPFVALLIGPPMALLLAWGSRSDAAGATALPLLTLLAICEVALIALALGAYLGLREALRSDPPIRKLMVASAACAACSLWFMLSMYRLWPL